MSFSITIIAKDKEAAKADFRVRFEEQVVKVQPSHAHDREAVFATVDTYVDLLVDDPTQRVSLAVHGSLSWRDEGVYLGASVGVSAWWVPVV